MKKRLLSILLSLATVFIFAACGSSSLTNKARNLEIGMTKKEVINVMGKGFTTLAARQTPEGALETIRYENIVEYPYIISFLDGKLVEWYVDEPRPENQHQHQHHHRNGKQ